MGTSFDFSIRHDPGHAQRNHYFGRVDSYNNCHNHRDSVSERTSKDKAMDPGDERGNTENQRAVPDSCNATIQVRSDEDEVCKIRSEVQEGKNGNKSRN